jgi:hypothetical protein
LAVILDRNGQFREAVDAIRACKTLQAAGCQKHLKSGKPVRQRLKLLMNGLTTRHFLAWKTEAEKLPPQRLTLFTGFPRSGTTLIEQALDAHPDLISSEERDYLGRGAFRAAIKDTGVNGSLSSTRSTTCPCDRSKIFASNTFP